MSNWLSFIRRHLGPLLVLVAATLYATAYLAAAGNGFGYYRRLSTAMLAGRFNVPAEQIDQLHLRDFSFYQGRYYYPLGALPAIALLPGVAAFGLNFPQGTLVLALAAATGFLTYVIARRLNFSERDSLWVCLAVLLGSPYAYLALRATVFDAYLAHLLSFTCLLSAMAEYLGKRRWWLCGMLVGLSAMARPLTILGSMFFAAAAITESRERNAMPPSAVQQLSALLLPLVASAALVAGYNWLRFQNPWEAGYTYQLIPPEVVLAREAGLFSLSHLPGNFSRAFLTGPRLILAQPGQTTVPFPYLTFDGKEGMSWLLTFPFLLLAVRARGKRREVGWAAAAAAAIALPNLLSFATGEHQYGYRYGFDFLPFLLLAVLAGLPEQRLGRTGKMLIVSGALGNAWLTLPVLLGFRT